MPVFNTEHVAKSYDSYKEQREDMMNELKKIIIHTQSFLEGNLFYYHETFTLFPELYNKQLNLFWLGQKNSTKICEIGFNAGHSAMVMLLGRDKTIPLDFTIFDIGQHRYVRPCLKYIESKFDTVKFEYIEGDSIISMPKWIDKNKNSIGTYDIVHVDGGHTEECIKNDMKNADILVKLNGYVIVDDTNIDYINSTVDLYISSGKYKEVNVLKTTGYQHRILEKIKNES